MCLVGLPPKFYFSVMSLRSVTQGTKIKDFFCLESFIAHALSMMHMCMLTFANGSKILNRRTGVDEMEVSGT